MSPPNHESELLARLMAGEGPAFDELMRAHQDRVFAVCLRLMGSRDRALDATQETFLTVFRKASQFQGRSALGTWIYRIAVNACYDQLRKATRRRTESLPDHFDIADPRSMDQLTATEIRPEIERALETLSPEFRAAVVLADMEGIPLPEVSAILGIPVGTVKSRVFRARRRLAEVLGNHSPR